jgi:hypothetical protein
MVLVFLGGCYYLVVLVIVFFFTSHCSDQGNFSNSFYNCQRYC